MTQPSSGPARSGKGRRAKSEVRSHARRCALHSITVNEQNCCGASASTDSAVAGPTNRRRVRAAECDACSPRHGGCHRLNEPTQHVRDVSQVRKPGRNAAACYDWCTVGRTRKRWRYYIVRENKHTFISFFHSRVSLSIYPCHCQWLIIIMMAACQWQNRALR